MRARFVVAAAAVLTMAGCVAGADEGAGSSSLPVEAGSPEELGLLDFLNDPATSFELLDVDVALDRRAAENLIAHRDGPDAAAGTGDDDPFDGIAEVDDVPWVGPVTLEQLLEWARSEGWVDAAAARRDAATLAFVNDPATSFEILDDEVPLDRRAAENIVAHRDGRDGAAGTADDAPFVSIADLDAVPYVGPAALDALAAYALAQGYDGGTGGGDTSTPPCAIFSEYLEGPGNNNKAVEIYNCGSEPLVLERMALCLVRNDDTECSNHAALAPSGRTLAPGDVWTVCRTRDGTFNDPFGTLLAACNYAVGGAATFDGDDRLVLFEDADGDGLPGAGDTILDRFGDPATRPWGTPWSEVSLRRCDTTPYLSGPFDVADSYTVHETNIYSDIGLPPTDDCSAEHRAGAGEDCLGTEHCEDGLRCYGIPSDGSTPYGKCVDPTPLPGEGARCDRWTPCADGLICAGWTLWGEGSCVPQWMAGRYETVVDATVHDPPSGGIAPSVVVYGLASVPVDLDVQLHLDHPRPADLRVTLIDPNGDTAVLWDRTPELGAHNRSFVTTGISRDDQVNGRWHLRVEDLVAGQTGIVERWSLFVVSRWD